MGYQNDPDGTRSNFSYVSEIGPKMWSQDGNCAHFGFCLGTKSPMMDPPNHAPQCILGRMKQGAAAATVRRMQRDQCWPTKQRRLFVSYFWTHNFKAG